MKFLILLMVIVIAFGFAAPAVRAWGIYEACDHGTWWDCIIAVFTMNFYNGIDYDEAWALADG